MHGQSRRLLPRVSKLPSPSPQKNAARNSVTGTPNPERMTLLNRFILVNQWYSTWVGALITPLGS